MLYNQSFNSSIPDRTPVPLTDGLPSYWPAAQREFSDAVHISRIGIQSRVNNNRMERYHGTFKERSKTMRAIKKPDSALIEGQRIYHDYLRPHTALEWKTPTEAAGINLQLKGNRWKELIRQSARSNQK
jgi:transposase-like protein